MPILRAFPSKGVGKERHRDALFDLRYHLPFLNSNNTFPWFPRTQHPRTVHAMHQRLSLALGLNAQGPLALAVRLHLGDKEALDLPNPNRHRVDHLLPKRAIVGQEVDHPHRAVRLRPSPPAASAGRGLVAPPLLVVLDRAHMHAVGQGGRTVHGRRLGGQKDGRGQKKGQECVSSPVLAWRRAACKGGILTSPPPAPSPRGIPPDCSTPPRKPRRACRCRWW